MCPFPAEDFHLLILFIFSFLFYKTTKPRSFPALYTQHWKQKPAPVQLHTAGFTVPRKANEKTTQVDAPASLPMPTHSTDSMPSAWARSSGRMALPG